MSATILDGKQLAKTLTETLAVDVSALVHRFGQRPRMVNLILGSDHSAGAYANSQKRTAEKIGIQYELVTLDPTLSQTGLINYLQGLNDDPSVHAVLLHKPVPPQIDYQSAVNAIRPEKDVEGMNATNLGRLLLGKHSLLPCTPAACMELIKTIPDFNLRGKEVVVVGRSEIVGKPVALLLLKESATVTICHGGTSEAGLLQAHLKRADVVVVAMGKANFIQGEWLKSGCVVVDVGINAQGDKITGDVDYRSCAKQAAYITPVPGGVGPVTVVMLMHNAIQAFKNFKMGSTI